ncbi:MAG TPA: multicopper oxidase domain-containing protein [Candidatus Dormibacteraeota bacterium]|nr:multicopper oxidase domain-containing protein [Candidatus Dormibacteraeota bacterium]
MRNNVAFNGHPLEDAQTPRGRRRRRRPSGGAMVRGLVAAVVSLSAGVVPAAAATQPPSPVPTARAVAKPLTPHVKLKPVKGTKAPKATSLLSLQAATPKVASSASLADSTCTPVLTLPPTAAATRTCDLYALTGTIGVPGIPTPVPIWGFSLNSVGPATLPGPTLVSFENESLKVNLHNQLPSSAGNLSLEIPQASMSTAPDTTGVANGGTATYTFSNLRPGTYVYEAGETANGPRQVAMGLTGMLIVRPSTWTALNHTAYNDTGSGFTAESPVELNEIDTSFNANPAGSDLKDYTPNVFLVNGHAFDPAFPSVGSIPVSNTDRLLLRYADLGLRERSISIADARQTEWASDTDLLPNQNDLAALYLNPVQTADTLTVVDPTSTIGTMIPVYDQGRHFQPSTAAGGQGGLGGMIAMITVVNGLSGVTAGPVTTVAASPKTNPGTDNLSVGGTISASTPLHAGTISNAEWFLDGVGAPGTGTAITGFPAASPAGYSFSIPSATLLAALAAQAPAVPIDGEHVIWVHGNDANGWGVVAGDSFAVNVTGPVVTHVSVHSTPNGGNRATDITGTPNPNDMAIVGSAVVSLSDYAVRQAELCIDAPCNAGGGPGDGNGTQLNLVSTADGSGANDPDAAIVGFSGAIDSATYLGFGPGTHTFYLHACEDAASSTATTCTRWGDTPTTTATADFVIDTQGPTVTNLTVTPDPNNGFQSGPGNTAYLDRARVDAILNDTATGNSLIALGEAFMIPTRNLQGNVLDCTTTAPKPADTGKGAEMVPLGGAWNKSATQAASAFIPLPDIRSCPEGKVRFWVHGQDQAGNWGAYATYDLTLDKTAPKVDSALVAPASPTTTTLTVTAHDPVSTTGSVVSSIVRAEYFLAPCTPGADATTCTQDPGPGNGTAIPVPTPATSVSLSTTITTPALGVRLFVRVMDAAGNWSVVDLTHPVHTF